MADGRRGVACQPRAAVVHMRCISYARSPPKWFTFTPTVSTASSSIFPVGSDAEAFRRLRAQERHPYGGTYTNNTGRTIIINPKSGLGDVVAEIGGLTL